MEYHKDLIIIGAGPSGLMAAATSSKLGLTSYLIEKKSKIDTYKRSCCSMILTEPGMHGEYLAFENDRICFLKNDFSVKYTGAYTDLWQSIRISPSGNTLRLGRKAFPVAKVINKAQLLRNLLDEIDESLVEILTSTVAGNLEEEDDGVIVSVVEKGRRFKLRAKLCLVCDGVNSHIVDILGLNRNRKHFFTSKVVSYVLDKTKIPYPNSWITFMGRSASPTGAIYMLPKPIGEDGKILYEISQGLPLIGEKNYSAKALLDNFIENSHFSEWFEDAEIIDVHGTTHIMRSPIRKPFLKRTIFVGDSAAFMEVDNQGALMCGFNAAKAAQKELEGEKGFDEYYQFWNTHFEFNDESLLSPIIKGFGFSAFSDDEIDYLFSLTQDTLYSGYVNHFTVGRVILNIFLEKLPQIEKEKPEIAKKLKSFVEKINS
ncbi:MAG: NAD(P)/FAD-dependent oxidoreductase [Candidatus Schekmanbacteria bacterium]|nr:MAG: NAD(P)/FAD-dependent oxidoreductase [Candidatus Schekmanbacteria bacterium]